VFESFSFSTSALHKSLLVSRALMIRIKVTRKNEFEEEEHQ